MADCEGSGHEARPGKYRRRKCWLIAAVAPGYRVVLIPLTCAAAATVKLRGSYEIIVWKLAASYPEAALAARAKRVKGAAKSWRVGRVD